MFSPEIIYTLDELPLYAGRLACITDVALAIEYNDADNWRVDAVGIVTNYAQFGAHDIEWIDDRDPLAALIRTKITELASKIEDQINADMMECV